MIDHPLHYLLLITETQARLWLEIPFVTERYQLGMDPEFGFLPLRDGLTVTIREFTPGEGAEIRRQTISGDPRHSRESIGREFGSKCWCLGQRPATFLQHPLNCRRRRLPRHVVGTYANRASFGQSSFHPPEQCHGDTLPTLRGCQIHGTHDGGLAIWLNLSEEQANRLVAKDTPRATTDASRPIDLTSGPYDGKAIGS